MVFDNGYVINLDIRTDRWLRMQSQLNAFGLGHFKRYSALSAKDIDISSVPSLFREKISSKLRKSAEQENVEYCIKAAWGCLQSHLGIIQLAKENQMPFVVILEDDCELEPQFNKVMEKFAQQIESVQWDIAYLGGNLNRRSKTKKIGKNILSVVGVNLAHAMLIKQSVYNTIIDEAPFSGLSIDDYYRKVLQSRVNTIMVYPPVAYQFYTDVSDISLTKKIFKFNTSSLKRAIKRKINRHIF